MFTLFGIICAVVVFGVFLKAILDTGSYSTGAESNNVPTEFDAELEDHIDSFQGCPHKNF